MDSELESNLKTTIPELIEQKGWDGFRDEELSLLKKMMAERSKGVVFACGGGIVEIPEARQILCDYTKSGGTVLFVQRDIKKVLAFLDVDKTRPAYSEQIEGVWLKRKPWYRECSNYQYHVQHSEAGARPSVSDDLPRFLALISGSSNNFDSLRQKRHSFFVSLTVPEVGPAVGLMKEVTVGSDAVELRVDLLDDPQDPGGLPSIEYVTEQVALLRSVISVPLIFTVRTKSQAGRFPDDAHAEALNLYRLAIRMGIDFIDLEIQFPDELLREVTENKGYSKIIASHHDPQGRLSWSNGSWIPSSNPATVTHPASCANCISAVTRGLYAISRSVLCPRRPRPLPSPLTHRSPPPCPSSRRQSKEHKISRTFCSIGRSAGIVPMATSGTADRLSTSSTEARMRRS